MNHLSNTILFLGWLAFTAYLLDFKNDTGAFVMWIICLILGIIFLIANNSGEDENNNINDDDLDEEE